MFLHRCYYAVKPLLPWRLRMALRRNASSGLRRRFAATWPIDPGSPRPPVGWPGWPHDRRFAFVITHDVEGPAGLAKCRALAELEMRLGFRSCFNFVPEGAYAAPKELRVWLLANGFEVGVHDLHHDGKLFREGSADQPPTTGLGSHRVSRRLHAAETRMVARSRDQLGFLDL